MTFAQIAGAPGVGSRRIEKLIDVLGRALGQAIPPSFMAGDPLDSGEELRRKPAGPSDAKGDQEDCSELDRAPLWIAGPITPDVLTETVWRAWCRRVHAHRLEQATLGRFARSLGDLPQGSWSIPLGEYSNKSLDEIWSLPGYGETRVGQVLDVFARVVATIGGCPTDAPLDVRLLPPGVGELIRWAEGVLRDESVPDVRTIRTGFLAPLLALVEADVGPEAAAMVRRRVGADGPAELLRQVGDDVGLTREGVRQIIARAAQALQVRWPEGRFLLDRVYTRFRTACEADESLDILRSALDACFGLDCTRGVSRGDVLAAWDRAGRAKATPMGEAEVRSWASREFPDMPADLIRRWLEEEGLRHVELGGDARYYSNDPNDLLLLYFQTDPEPVLVGDLGDFVDEDGAELRLRVGRDPRFIEDESRRVLPAEHYSVHRRDGRWSLRLDRLLGLEGNREVDSVAIGEFIHMIVGGLAQAGIGDATAIGVHRFTRGLLRTVYGAALPPSVTPPVLASILTRHSGGLMRPMRRRRLRWVGADGSIPVRGTRGWIDHVAAAAGVPMTLDELDAALRGHYQDYEPHVRQHLELDPYEEGEVRFGYSIIPGVQDRIPGILVPRGWELDLARPNVSEGIRLLVAQLVAAGGRSGCSREDLWLLPWLVRLCEHAASGKMRWDERRPSGGAPGIRPASKAARAPRPPR